jgi:transposase
MSYSRLSFVVPTFGQDLQSVIEIDKFKAAVETADRYTPRFNKTFLEYANYRGFLVDAARPRHPKDKTIIENGVRYARERFWKGETLTMPGAEPNGGAAMLPTGSHVLWV